MGATFERIFIRGKYSVFSEKRVEGAAEKIGYTKSMGGRGVPFNIGVLNDNMEWLLLDSPLFAKEGFISAVAESFGEPVLKISCVDSDFAVLTLNCKGQEAFACINRPYDGIELPDPEPSVWAAACKKKWKCKDKQFAELFETGYDFAEDGLSKLADLIMLPKEALTSKEPNVFTRDYWLVPKVDFDASPFPRTLPERLSDYIDKKYAEKLSELGFRRLKGNSLRWNRVSGEEGKEIVSSLVFAVRYNEIEILYGIQPLCCPLVLSDKYYPMHDAPTYWLEAEFELPRQLGIDPLVNRINGIDHRSGMYEPETIDPYLNELILPAFEKVKDLRSCREFSKKSRLGRLYMETGRTTRSYGYRCFAEAILDGDGIKAQEWAERLSKNEFESEYVPNLLMSDDLPDLFMNGGIPACLEELDRARVINLKRLKNGGAL